MSKESISTANHPAKTQKPKPIVAEQATQEKAPAAETVSLIGTQREHTTQAQAAHLGDLRFRTAQRQGMASQIGRKGGNHQLQKVMAQMQRSEDRGAESDHAQDPGERLLEGEPAREESRPNPGGRETLQRDKPEGNSSQNLPAPRVEVELIGSRLKSRQVDLNSFLEKAKGDVTSVQNYFAWVNSVYKRSHEHFAMVIAQANAEAETQQAWVDFAVGVATGVAVGVLFEVTLAAGAAKAGIELLSEVGAELVEGGLGKLIKVEVPKATLLQELAPELKEIQSLKNLDLLNKTLLEAAVPGTFVYTDPIVQAERLTAELRVAEAGGSRRMTDQEVREQYLKLMKFDMQSLRLEQTLKDKEAAFAQLREAVKQPAPEDQRCEQDIWIPWIAKQAVDTFWAPILLNPVIQNHLVDIGLAGRYEDGGRLNAHVSAQHPASPRTAAEKLKAAAANAAPALPPFWKKVFLIG